jgi:hypothetical protein
MVVQYNKKVIKMKSFNKNAVFSLLATTSLSLAFLSPVHGVKQALELEFNDNSKVRYTRKHGAMPISLKNSDIKCQKHAIQIGSTSISIDSSQPLDKIVEDLRNQSNIRNVTVIKLSLDERCTKRISKFNLSFENIPPDQLQEKVNLYRTLYVHILKHKDDSPTAKRHIPLIQNQMGCALAQLADSIDVSAKLSLLEEAFNLCDESVKAGYEEAKGNRSAIRVERGAVQVLLSDTLELSQKIPLFREVMNVFTEEKALGTVQAVRNIPGLQVRLAVALASLSETENSVAQRLPLLEESTMLLAQSAGEGNAEGALLLEELFLKLELARQ